MILGHALAVCYITKASLDLIGQYGCMGDSKLYSTQKIIMSVIKYDVVIWPGLEMRLGVGRFNP